MTANKKIISIAIVLILSIILIRFFDAPLKNKICTKGIVSFELAKDLSNSKAILNSWNDYAKNSALYSLLYDFVFIIIYTSFIAMLVQKTKFKIKKAIVYLVFLAGFFDVVENIALLNLLHQNMQQYWSSIAFYAASTKFLFLVISLLYLILNVIIYMINRIFLRTKTDL